MMSTLEMTVDEKFEAMRRKNEELRKRHQEVLKDKEEAKLQAALVMNLSTNDDLMPAEREALYNKENSNRFDNFIEYDNKSRSEHDERNSWRPTQDDRTDDKNTRKPRQEDQRNSWRSRQDDQVDDKYTNKPWQNDRRTPMHDDDKNTWRNMHDDRNDQRSTWRSRQDGRNIRGPRQDNRVDDDGTTGKDDKVFMSKKPPPPDPNSFLHDSIRDNPRQEGQQFNRTREFTRRRNEGVNDLNRDTRRRPEYQPRGDNIPFRNINKHSNEDKIWKEERAKIDEERINRQKTSNGQWRRAWDNEKVYEEEDDFKDTTFQHQKDSSIRTISVSERLTQTRVVPASESVPQNRPVPISKNRFPFKVVSDPPTTARPFSLTVAVSEEGRKVITEGDDIFPEDEIINSPNSSVFDKVETSFGTQQPSHPRMVRPPRPRGFWGRGPITGSRTFRKEDDNNPSKSFDVNAVVNKTIVNDIEESHLLNSERVKLGQLDHRNSEPRQQDHRNIEPRQQGHRNSEPRQQDHRNIEPRQQDHRNTELRQQDHRNTDLDKDLRQSMMSATPQQAYQIPTEETFHAQQDYEGPSHGQGRPQSFNDSTLPVTIQTYQPQAQNYRSRASVEQDYGPSTLVTTNSYQIPAQQLPYYVSSAPTVSHPYQSSPPITYNLQQYQASPSPPEFYQQYHNSQPYPSQQYQASSSSPEFQQQYHNSQTFMAQSQPIPVYHPQIPQGYHASPSPPTYQPQTQIISQSFHASASPPQAQVSLIYPYNLQSQPQISPIHQSYPTQPQLIQSYHPLPQHQTTQVLQSSPSPPEILQNSPVFIPTQAYFPQPQPFIGSYNNSPPTAATAPSAQLQERPSNVFPTKIALNTNADMCAYFNIRDIDFSIPPPNFEPKKQEMSANQPTRSEVNDDEDDDERRPRAITGNHFKPIYSKNSNDRQFKNFTQQKPDDRPNVENWRNKSQQFEKKSGRNFNTKSFERKNDYGFGKDSKFEQNKKFMDRNKDNNFSNFSNVKIDKPNIQLRINKTSSNNSQVSAKVEQLKVIDDKSSEHGSWYQDDEDDEDISAQETEKIKAENVFKVQDVREKDKLLAMKKKAHEQTPGRMAKMSEKPQTFKKETPPVSKPTFKVDNQESSNMIVGNQQTTNDSVVGGQILGESFNQVSSTEVVKEDRAEYNETHQYTEDVVSTAEYINEHLVWNNDMSLVIENNSNTESVKEDTVGNDEIHLQNIDDSTGNDEMPLQVTKEDSVENDEIPLQVTAGNDEIHLQNIDDSTGNDEMHLQVTKEDSVENDEIPLQVTAGNDEIHLQDIEEDSTGNDEIHLQDIEEDSTGNDEMPQQFTEEDSVENDKIPLQVTEENLTGNDEIPLQVVEKDSKRNNEIPCVTEEDSTRNDEIPLQVTEDDLAGCNEVTSEEFSDVNTFNDLNEQEKVDFENLKERERVNEIEKQELLERKQKLSDEINKQKLAREIKEAELRNLQEQLLKKTKQ